MKGIQEQTKQTEQTKLAKRTPDGGKPNAKVAANVAMGSKLRGTARTCGFDMPANRCGTQASARRAAKRYTAADAANAQGGRP